VANYITDAELKAQLSITDTTDDTAIALAATAGSRLVDSITGRQFAQHTGDASARVFLPMSSCRTYIDDAYEITAVAIGAGDGAYGTTLTVSTDYWTLPYNGVGGDNQTGWPASIIETAGRFTCAQRPTVQVTAKWGWTATPSTVKQAAMFLAVRMFRLRDVPFGMVAGGLETGPLPVRDIKDVTALLRPFIKVRGIA
jgi:hypothetical protein